MGHTRFAPVLLLLFATSCGPGSDEVVVYTSVDQVYAQEVFQAFTRETGLKVRPLFDTEEAKTLGLVHRLVAERDHPQADVFWNGECARTAWLNEKGLIQPFRALSAEGIDMAWRDSKDGWTGFAARARVIVYNTDKVKSPPKTLQDLRTLQNVNFESLILTGDWRGKSMELHLRRKKINLERGFHLVQEIPVNR